MHKLFIILGIMVATSLPAPDPIKIAPLKTNFLAKGFALNVYWAGCGVPMEACEYIQLKGSHSTKQLKDLTDLKGAVTINSPARARDYVRLRTSPSTWYLWPGNLMVEVIDRRQFKEMVSYGLRYDSQMPPNGFEGVITEARMKQLGLSEIRIKSND